MTRASRPLVSGAIVLGVGALTVGTLKLLSPVADVGLAWGDPPPAVVVEDGDRSVRAEGSVSRAEVREGVPVGVTLSIDGVEQGVSTTATTVTDLLVAEGIVLDGYATSHDLDAPVVSGMRVVVAKVAWGDETVETSVPFETVEVEDPELPAGERVVRTAGRAGTAVTTYLVSMIDGAEVSRSEVVSVITNAATDEVVRVGTGSTPQPTERPTRAPVPAASPTPDLSDALDPAARPDPAPSAAPEPDATPAPEPTTRPTEAPSGTPGTTPASAKALARTMAADRGWSGKQFTCLAELWEKESNWRYQAANPSSTARGIPQALMSIHFGSDWRSNAAAARYLSTPSVQIAWGLSYIGARYDSPCAAWKHSQAKNWY